VIGAEAIGGIDFVVRCAGPKRLGMIEMVQVGGIAVPGVQARGGPRPPCEQAVADDALVGGLGFLVGSRRVQRLQAIGNVRIFLSEPFMVIS